MYLVNVFFKFIFFYFIFNIILIFKYKRNLVFRSFTVVWLYLSILLLCKICYLFIDKFFQFLNQFLWRYWFLEHIFFIIIIFFILWFFTNIKFTLKVLYTIICIQNDILILCVFLILWISDKKTIIELATFCKTDLWFLKIGTILN